MHISLIGAIISSLNICELAIHSPTRVRCHMALHTRVPNQQTQKSRCMPTRYYLLVNLAMPSSSRIIILASTWVPTQPIGIKVGNSKSMHNLEIILLEDESPTCKLPRELARLHQPLERLMIGDKGKLRAKQVTSEVCYSPYCYQTLSLVRTITRLCCVVRTTGICNHKLITRIIKLCQHRSKSQHTPISVQLEWTPPDRSPQDRRGHQLVLEL